MHGTSLEVVRVRNIAKSTVEADDGVVLEIRLIGSHFKDDVDHLESCVQKCKHYRHHDLIQVYVECIFIALLYLVFWLA